ncbi:Ig-like domain-containing protein [Staphylococcus aureus]|uniref:Ig-like domain-containing protein n=1 Tax=Staphylococcus aureus TaxID=1280 RepID=UPI0006BA8AA5|nr:Ig-like domain-containing protein [Staphylococcus aureus]
MNHKEGYKKRYKMYKSGKFWVVAGLLFLGNIAISDVHASAQESENTTVKAATEVMEIGDPITEKSVVKEKIDNEGGLSEEKVDTHQENVASTQVEEKQKNKINESAEVSGEKIDTHQENVASTQVEEKQKNKINESAEVSGEKVDTHQENVASTQVEEKQKNKINESAEVSGEKVDTHQETKKHSSITTTPRKNDYAHDTTPGVINLAVYQIQNLSGQTAHPGRLVVSFDPSTGKTYGMKYINGAIYNRKELTKSYQEFGFGKEAVVRLTNDGKSYEISTNNNGNRLDKERDYTTLDPNKSTSKTWYGIYRNQPLPTKKTVSVNFLDADTNSKIKHSEVYTFYEGYHYDVTLKDYKKIGDYDHIKTVGKLSHYLYGKDNNINLFYKKSFDKDAHKSEVNQPTEGDKSITGTGTPGDDIKVTDKDGKVIGEGKVGEDGKFEITPTRPLVPGEKITATPSKDGKEGTPSDTTKKQTLPQTGIATSSGLMSLGAILSILSGLFIFRRNK